MSKKTERRAIDKVFILLGLVITVVLLVVGTLAWYGYSFTTGMVKDQLSAQKIYFPAKDSAAFEALPSEDQQEVGKYAGQQLVDGDQAKVYANNFIGSHLKKVADGKTYAEVSSESMKNPSDETLKAQKATLFQGEMLRGTLLGNGYAFWTFGMIAKFVALASFAGAIMMTILVLLGLRHLAKLR